MWGFDGMEQLIIPTVVVRRKSKSYSTGTESVWKVCLQTGRADFSDFHALCFVNVLSLGVFFHRVDARAG